MPCTPLIKRVNWLNTVAYSVTLLSVAVAIDTKTIALRMIRASSLSYIPIIKLSTNQESFYLLQCTIIILTYRSILSDLPERAWWIIATSHDHWRSVLSSTEAFVHCVIDYTIDDLLAYDSAHNWTNSTSHWTIRCHGFINSILICDHRAKWGEIKFIIMIIILYFLNFLKYYWNWLDLF